MRFLNTEVQEFSPGDNDGQPTVSEVMHLTDRSGNVLATFTLDASGVLSHDLPVTAAIQVLLDAKAPLIVPTEDPGVAGQLWNDEGTLSISTGA
jgi:hypothetical protein